MSSYLPCCDDYCDDSGDPRDDIDPNVRYEPVLCASCNGSGEGMYDGSRCSTCNGKGEVLEEGNDPCEED